MTDDEQFEAYMRKRFGVSQANWRGTVLGEDLRDCWRAARAAAIEEAAQRVMTILGYPPREYYADAIRALREGKS